MLWYHLDEGHNEYILESKGEPPLPAPVMVMPFFKKWCVKDSMRFSTSRDHTHKTLKLRISLTLGVMIRE